MAQDLAQLNTAWSEIWARGDQEMVRLANKLLSACMDLMDVSTDRQPAGSVAARVRRWGVGERLTPEMQASIGNGRKEMAHARERLANHARHVLGQPPVTLFGHIRASEHDETSPPAPSGTPQSSSEPGTL
jgi:hypothetical protein